MNTLKEIQNKFDEIYRNNEWTYGSGLGSVYEFAEPYIPCLLDVIKDNNIKTVLDFGCGDWQFSKFIKWNQLVDKYIGVDVAKYIIENNIKEYSSENVEFQYIDTDFIIPEVDLIVCKDVLMHLPNVEVAKLIKKFRKKSKYILITNDVGYGENNYIDTDINIGQWRKLDLLKKPWSLKGTIVKEWGQYEDDIVKQTILIKND
jgi:SAM-dependent methyltransferase